MDGVGPWIGDDTFVRTCLHPVCPSYHLQGTSHIKALRWVLWGHPGMGNMDPDVTERSHWTQRHRIPGSPVYSTSLRRRYGSLLVPGRLCWTVIQSLLNRGLSDRILTANSTGGGSLITVLPCAQDKRLPGAHPAQLFSLTLSFWPPRGAQNHLAATVLTASLCFQ